MSLANDTDAFVLAPVARRTRYDGYTLVEVPERRDFYFGNMLVLDREPDPAEIPGWIASHARHFANTGIRRHTLVWERRAAAAAQRPLAVDAAWDVARRIVFTRSTPFAERSRPDDRIRAIASDGDWVLAAELDDLEHGAALGTFARWRFGTVRESARAGRLRMLGLWEAGRLAAFAGIYAGDGVARFETPVTHPAFRRRGAFRALCTTLVDDALERAPAVPVVICAVAGEAPDAIYRKLGFEAAGEQIGLTCPVGWSAADRFEIR